MKMKLTTKVLIGFGAAIIVHAGLWTSWIHGTRITEVRNGAVVDTLLAEIRRLPINRTWVYMYMSPKSTGFYCYQISIFLEPRGGPALESRCLAFDSVMPDESKIEAKWLDLDTLRVNFAGLGSVEIDAWGP